MKAQIFAFFILMISTFTIAGQDVLTVGDKAPSFKAIADDGTTWDINKFLGKKILVVYFYPAAMTGGCTKQACSYRDHKDDF